MCTMSTWAYLQGFGLQHNNWDRTILFSRRESAANRTRTQLGLLGAVLLENHPKSKAKQTSGQETGSLWVDFSMCLIACMSRWWSWCGDGPVEVSCSVSAQCLSVVGFVDGLQSESSGGQHPPEPPVRRLLVPWPPPQPFLCRLAFSLASLVF